MDQVKKRGPKSKADKTKEALDVALPKAGEVAQQLADNEALEESEPSGMPPSIAALDLDTTQPAELPAAAASQPSTVIRIDLPDYLRDCALALNDTLQCPADVRGRIQSELGCRFDLVAGLVRAHDGRTFGIHHDEAGHALELTSA